MSILEYASLTGHSFSLSERAAIQAASALLLAETKQTRLKVWGKVYGSKNDYILIQCIGNSALSTCITFFSIDEGVSFSLLDMKPLDDSRAQYCKEIQGPYMGDPAYEYRVEDAVTKESVPVKESERLAWFASLHDYHCRVIPRGSQVLHEDGTIRLNPMFEGLSLEEAGRLGYYFHLRPQRAPASLLETEGVNKSSDFLDPLTADIPTGIWSLKYDALLNVVYGINLMIEGAVFCHRPQSTLFGNIYMGDGTINENVAFAM